MFGIFEFGFIVCHIYNKTIDKINIEEVITEFLDKELNSQGADEEGDVIYAYLKIRFEVAECSESHISSQRVQRNIYNKGGLIILAFKKYNNKKNKRKEKTSYILIYQTKKPSWMVTSIEISYNCHCYQKQVSGH